MNSKQAKKILFFIVFTLAILVRVWKMEYIPYQSDWDEYAYIFAGQTLIETGQPTSITTFPDDYALEIKPTADLPEILDLNIKGSFVLATPWLDHPPLLPLISGAWVKLFNYSFPSHVPSIIYRLPIIFFSSATLLLVYLITKKLFSFYPALFSLILIGFTPSIIFIQRMIVGENLYLPLLLLTLYFTLNNKKTYSMVIPTVLAGLTKITGLITVPITVSYLILKKQYKKATIYTITSLFLFIFIYSFYGYLIDWTQFIHILKVQSFRLLGWTNPAFIFSHPGFHQQVIKDAGYYLILITGFISLFLPSQKPLINKFLRLAIFGSLLLVWLTSPEKAMLGWYKLPFFTFLSISAAKLITKKIDYSLIILLAITIINNYGLIRYAVHPYPEPELFRGVLILVFGSLFTLTLIPKITQQFKKRLLIVLLAFYIISSFYITDKYYDSTCEHKFCPLPILTLKQLIKPNFQ
ncbi:glycosyltransferase family 39 protein [Patescibacteria group bacterium]